MVGKASAQRCRALAWQPGKHAFWQIKGLLESLQTLALPRVDAARTWTLGKHGFARFRHNPAAAAATTPANADNPYELVSDCSRLKALHCKRVATVPHERNV